MTLNVVPKAACDPEENPEQKCKGGFQNNFKNYQVFSRKQAETLNLIFFEQGRKIY
jgi:hypothetical protein